MCSCTAKAAALDAALRQIEAQYGKGSVLKMGDGRPMVKNSDVISTGSLTVDRALGIGGLPRGRVIEIYGPEASGKTTLALSTIAQAQKKGLNCHFVDAEHALDPMYAEALGVNMADLYVSQPDTGEAALEIADIMVRSAAMDVLVIDSVAALVPKAELEGEMGDHHMALQARLMSQALRKLTGGLSKSKCMLIFINQIRSKVGVIFGSPEVTAGGNALKFYSSVRLEIRRTGQIKGKDNAILGNTTRVKVVKNKMAPPFKEAEFDMEYGRGISKTGELIDLAVQYGLLEKKGAHYRWPDDDKSFANGRDKCKAYFEDPDNATEIEELEEAVRTAMLGGDGAAEEPTTESDEDDEASHTQHEDDTERTEVETTGSHGASSQPFGIGIDAVPR